VRKAVLKEIESLLDSDESVIFIGSDLGHGTMSEAKRRHPNRVFMEGISEQHLVGFAAGLALEGFVPFVHTIGTFLTRRALEQIIVDVALQNLPVKFIASGGGMVYAPLGPTHQSIDDFSLMRSIPNMIIAAPADSLEMVNVVQQISKTAGPAYVRVAKGGESIITANLPELGFGQIRQINAGGRIAIITTGVLLHECYSALKLVDSHLKLPTIFHVPYLAPINYVKIREILQEFSKILIVEEHLPTGGLFTAVAEIAVKDNLSPKILHASLPNEYASKYGTQFEHWVAAGLDSQSIARMLNGI
jgi:transketolase